jgi:hypothetical protein
VGNHVAKEKTSKPHFESILQSEVPQGRRGKHHQTVEMIIGDLEQLAPGRAMKIELEQLPDSKENVRSALNRETRLRGMNISTSSDEHFLYVWKSELNENGRGGK